VRQWTPRSACGLAAVSRGRLPSGAGKRPRRPASGPLRTQGRENGLHALAGGSRGYAEDVRHERRKGLRQGRVKKLRRAARPPRPACRTALAHAAIKGGERGYAASVWHAARPRRRQGRGKGLRRAAHPPRGWPPWPAPPPSCEALFLSDLVAAMLIAA